MVSDPSVYNRIHPAFPGSTFEEELARGLPEDIRRRTVAFGVVESTNTYVRTYAADLADDAIVAADSQTAGHGRLGRSWHSEPGRCVLVSVLANLGDVPEVASLLPIAAAVAVTRSVEELVANTPGPGRYPAPPCEYATESNPVDHVSIKWPNDVLVDGRKIAGILAASLPDDRYVVGVGLNVGRMQFPPEFGNRAASIADLTSRPVSRVAALIRVVRNIDASVADLRTPDGRAKLLAAYRSRLASVGREVQFQSTTDGQPIIGVLSGIQDDGSIVIQVAGRDSVFHAGDLTTRRTQRTP